MRVFLGTLWSSIKKTNALYVLYCEHGIAVHATQGNRASSLAEGEVSLFLELQREPGVYSRVKAGRAIQNSYLFSDVRTPVYLKWIPQESKLGLAGQYKHF